MNKEEFKIQLSNLLEKRQIAIMKREDTKLIDSQIKKIKHEYAKELLKEKKENAKYKK